ncbi:MULTISPECIES: copper chaperone CopZ [Cytobacillus]|uniref:copper chaperone CopZ n=1 Tax=Cytobacillus TaxID=2675230 RepID=UPI001CD5E741|nr:copper chaperone CopZ [Cytobacillus kochii]MCA1028316.1 copper chaperone CopZ [Cytobacillus kochii]MCM3320999.1 copper chaperone CopZ [Cytobacillus kochii]MCM3344168.1 copper chaperone CopZ [Cytobacillus kochii]MDM5208011.1 copper chaperone CopZ [Cytobacillus kochii]
MENVILHVEGMSCGHCVKAVESSVGELKGVDTVKVDLDKKEVKVAFDASSVKLDQIKETIDDQGYEVKS